VTPEEFVAAQTVVSRAPLVPEIALHLASEITPIWQATEAWLADQDARLAMTKPRPIPRPVFIVELREFIAFCIVMGAGVGALLAIGGM
jgi:hypothetical protein